jgi:transposase
MLKREIGHAGAPSMTGDEHMLKPEEAAAMVRLKELGWGVKRIARELGCARNTVRRYVAAGGWVAYREPKRKQALAGLDDWLAAAFGQHRGNCDVVRQELVRAHGLAVSLRTVERACAPWRREREAQAKATVRFETAPGRQLQIDFGQVTVAIAGERQRMYLFVATLGYSRRLYVAAFTHERQAAWFTGLEGAFGHFGGVTEEVLLDNARALVESHDIATRQVVFNARLLAFARYWGFVPRACAPYRPRTKGKDERGVGYVKGNAIAGHRFDSFAHLEAHLAWWAREVADARVHGTTGEVPVERFGEEARHLKPLAGQAPFVQGRELIRRVHSDGCIELDTNAYSVPWRLIGETVRVQVGGGRVRVRHGGQEVACHPEAVGRRGRTLDRAHLVGLVGAASLDGGRNGAVPVVEPSLLRPLAEYEAVAGGRL